MSENKARKQANKVTIIWLIIALLVVAGGTFAWFNFQTSTNVEPGTGGTVTEGAGNLMISTSPDGPWSNTCNLVLESSSSLDPVSTADLTSFYTAATHDSNYITILYSDVSSEVNQLTMHGKVYLKSDGGKIDLYLYKNRMTFGDDVQALAAMRFGMIITSNEGTSRYIFNLDDMADTSGAEKMQTTSEKNVVVSSITDGAPNYVPDTSKSISAYSAVGKSADDMSPMPGKNKLATLHKDEIIAVEYFLYLEGCDENCVNQAQLRNVALALSFSGHVVQTAE